MSVPHLELTKLETTIMSDAFRGIFSNILNEGQHLREIFNRRLVAYEPLVLVGGSGIIAYGIHYMVIRIPNDGIYAGVKRTFFRIRNRIPFIKSIIDRELAKSAKSITDNVEKLYRGGNENCKFITVLPKGPMSSSEILVQVESYLKLGYNGSDGGLMSGALYHGGEGLTKLNTKVYEMSSWSNTLHAEVFPGILKMEAEIVRMVADLFHGDSESCGSVTSCGTESILLAVKAYRDYGTTELGILHPEILVASSAHPAFNKAAQLYNIKIKSVPLDQNTYTVDVKAMKKMITRNTVMIVGSAPAYPHGCMDNIKAISEIGLKHNIPVHVDACLGGFLIAFMSKAGFPLEPFDFQLPGVTSISADTHKYGSAPKGSSILLFRSKKLRQYQYFIHTEWCGGLYASQTLAGSRAGALIAVCWTTMLYFGMSGYVDMTKSIIQTARHIKYQLKQIQGIDVMGNPEVSIIALKSEEFDIYRLLEAMKSKGWVMNALQFPSSIHFCLSYNQTAPGVADKFLKDIRDAVEVLMSDPDSETTGVAAIYGTSQTVSDRSIVSEITAIYLDTLYETNF
ncbi:sphingosine-1-phosphate lyase [Folsomia candida]|uniref:sphingosine-1-phosphate lyase n=1 Tax=Folsomia candida TaxID=158441 RepID=UPI000B9046A2|nr:sphingosine-1-phosphate lyase [Folsomia candida]